MPYKYIVSVDSKSFSEAHPTIMNVLHRLSWAAQKVVHDGSFTEFNELLAVGYFEDQRMNVSLFQTSTYHLSFPHLAPSALIFGASDQSRHSIMMTVNTVWGQRWPPCLSAVTQ